MKSIVPLSPIALATSLVLCSLTTAGPGYAQTGPGKVTLTTGSSVFGVVQETVPGEYVVILLPHGETRTIPWSSISLVRVHGYPAVGPDALPPPTTSYFAKSALPSGPPGASPGSADAPSGSPALAAAPRDYAFAVGVSGTVLTTTGRSPHGLGLGGEARLVVRLVPSFSLYSLVEGARFDASHAGSIGATSWFVGGGARLSSNPTGTSALFDLASGVRTLSVDADRSLVRRVAIPLRIGVGIGFATGARTRADLLVQVAPHVRSYRSEPTCSTDLCTPRTPTPAGFVSVSLGFDLDV